MKNLRMDDLKKHKMLTCIVIFFVCLIARIIEYFFIRTDETIVAENFIHKVFGICLLALILFVTDTRWETIGFCKNGFVKNILKGLLLGLICFTVAYTIEGIVLYTINGSVKLEFYASGFSLDGGRAKQTGIGFIVLCILFNLINVWMEEGVFRGLFSELLKDMTFMKSAVFIAFLFGLWHWVMLFVTIWKEIHL